jgi:hypothetical protein
VRIEGHVTGTSEPVGYWGEKPSAQDKAAVTSLRPVVEDLTVNLRRLTACLLQYRGGVSTRPPDSEEQRVAMHFRPLFGEEKLECFACSWCGEGEEGYRRHYTLDDAGFAVRRGHAQRFICSLCFYEGKDLAQPTPPLVRPTPAVQTVTCDPAPLKQLPPAGARLLGPHTESLAEAELLPRGAA